MTTTFKKLRELAAEMAALPAGVLDGAVRTLARRATGQKNARKAWSNIATVPRDGLPISTPKNDNNDR